MVDGWQEGTAVVLHATVTARGRDCDERGEVVAFRSQSVTNPGADAWPHQIGLAGVQSQQGFAVSAAFGVDRANDTELVRLPGKVRKKLAHPDAALAMLRELERRPQDLAELIALVADVFPRQRFPGVLV